MFLPDNTRAPNFSFKAVVSNRPVTLQSAAGAMLLVFLSYRTHSIGAEVIRAVRESYPSPDQVLVAAIADMRIVPRLLRGTAKALIRNAYNEAASQIPPEYDPADHIIILTDWSGALFEAYRVPTTSRQVALVLVNDAKEIAGSYFGSQPAEAALSLIDGSRISSDSKT